VPTIRDPKQLRELVIDAAIDLIALGLDPQHATLFVQSDIPEVTELTWLLMTMAPMGLLEKCHAYKDKVSKGLPADAGLFTYPVLMAADILLYDSDIVPVGADQVQHIEVTRDLAMKFNHQYGDILVLPNARVLDESAKVPGTDGEKMSKSYGNTIDVFEPEKPLRKKIMAIKTDSTPVEAPKKPDTCHIFTLYKLFASAEQQAALAARYRAGGMGYGEAKQALFEIARDYFAAARERREKLVADPSTIQDILRDGAQRARTKGAAVLDRARSACGLRPRQG
jgi:tryptophanyl-tRNA synthetase